MINTCTEYHIKVVFLPFLLLCFLIIALFDCNYLVFRVHA
jgi:hypothetical protein